MQGGNTSTVCSRDAVELRKEASRSVHRRRINRTSIRQKAGRIDQVYVPHVGQLARLGVYVADRQSIVPAQLAGDLDARIDGVRRLVIGRERVDGRSAEARVCGGHAGEERRARGRGRKAALERRGQSAVGVGLIPEIGRRKSLARSGQGTPRRRPAPGEKQSEQQAALQRPPELDRDR